MFIRISSLLKTIIVILMFCTIQACEKLEVENSNLPDSSRLLNTPNDVKELVENSFLSYWRALKSYGFGLQAPVMADHTTGSIGFDWAKNSHEPRLPMNNDPSYGWSHYISSPYFDLHSVISNINDALFEITVNGVSIGQNGEENPMVEATSYLLRGLSLGQIGLTYEKSMVPQSPGDFTELEFLPWNQVLEKAIQDLERAIDISKNNSFVWPERTVSGITMDNTYIAKLANSYSARFLVLGARTKSQNDELSWTSIYDWTDVITFTENGLTSDFAPVGDGLPWQGGVWWDLSVKYLRQPAWGRIDCRIINLLDPEYPVRYPTNEEGLPLPPPIVHSDINPGEAKSIDTRFETDYQFLVRNNFLASRGGWHYSHYRFSRYDYPQTTNTEGNFMGESIGPIKELTAYDNQLMMAEAYVRTNNIAQAVAILNNPANPRKARGGLPDVTDDYDDVTNAIFYERDIELTYCGYGIHFFDMRRRDLLQYGTPIHLPLPGKELKNLMEDIYNFGGIENADGVNTSIGGDWIKPYYHFTPSW